MSETAELERLRETVGRLQQENRALQRRISWFEAAWPLVVNVYNEACERPRAR
jgi:hypothetical protein